MKINFFKKENNFKKAKSHWSPSFFWKVAVFVLLIVIIYSCFFGYYLFVQINKEIPLNTKNDNPQIQTIKKERIDKVLEYFSTREKKSNQILSSPVPVVDPSL